jgi:hypothetical protein
MFDQFELGSEFFEGLEAADAAITARVAAAACPRCGGPLHAGNYRRKPRGALAARAGEAFSLRFSLCCGRRGCRRRATPPSLRFLGRRVYLGAVVIVASVVALLAATAAAAHRATGVAPRTARRWARWWRGGFPETSVFAALSARLVPAVARAQLPASLLARLMGAPEARVARLLALLAPMTTESTADGARFVRGLA